MSKIPMTYQIAHAAGMDAGNASMAKNGRAAWNEDDYNECERVTNSLLDMISTPGDLRIYNRPRPDGTIPPIKDFFIRTTREESS